MIPPELGPDTPWERDINTLSPRRQDIVARALSALGVHEDPPGSNRGHRIDEWLQRCHTSTGQPWCAAFASWCIDTCRDAVRCVRRARDLVRFASTGVDTGGTCPETVLSMPFLATEIAGTL